MGHVLLATHGERLEDPLESPSARGASTSAGRTTPAYSVGRGSLSGGEVLETVEIESVYLAVASPQFLQGLALIRSYYFFCMVESVNHTVHTVRVQREDQESEQETRAQKSVLDTVENQNEEFTTRTTSTIDDDVHRLL